MSISKQYLLEQIKRSRAIDTDEMILYKDYKGSNEQWWINHNEGHKFVLDTLEKVINNYNYKKHDLLKILNKLMKKSDKETDALDKKYKYFESNEDMSIEDNKKYAYFDGISCKCYSLKMIIQNKIYYSKDSYIKTDWSKLGFRRKDDK